MQGTWYWSIFSSRSRSLPWFLLVLVWLFMIISSFTILFTVSFTISLTGLLSFILFLPKRRLLLLSSLILYVLFLRLIIFLLFIYICYCDFIVDIIMLLWQFLVWGMGFDRDWWRWRWKFIIFFLLLVYHCLRHLRSFICFERADFYMILTFDL